MHINENGSSFYVGSKKRHISREDITYLFVCKFLSFPIFYLNFFCKGLTFYEWGNR
jgi:hypothetical protein